VAVDAETERERGTRRHRRTLFDGVAQLYEVSRCGYPAGLVEFVVTTAAQRAALPAEMVIGVENTRAVVLSWPEDVRRDFTDELRRHLRSQAEVQLTQLTSLTMARVLPRSE
jgi:hypothetical protein